MLRRGSCRVLGCLPASAEKGGDERAEQGLAPSACIVHELEKGSGGAAGRKTCARLVRCWLSTDLAGVAARRATVSGRVGAWWPTTLMHPTASGDGLGTILPRISKPSAQNRPARRRPIRGLDRDVLRTVTDGKYVQTDFQVRRRLTAPWRVTSKPNCAPPFQPLRECSKACVSCPWSNSCLGRSRPCCWPFSGPMPSWSKGPRTAILPARSHRCSSPWRATSAVTTG